MGIMDSPFPARRSARREPRVFSVRTDPNPIFHIDWLLLAAGAAVVALAGYCQQHRGELDAWRLAVALALAGLPMALVMAQNDLGTTLVMAVCVIAMLVVAGLKPLHVVVLALVGATLVGALIVSGTF